MRVYVGEGVYNITATGENAAGLMRLLAVTAPSAGGKYLSPKFEEFVEAVKVEVQVGNIRQTPSGLVAADLTISEGGVAVKYNVYLRETDILLQFRSSDRSRVELAAHLLRLAGVATEVRKEGGRDEWYINAYTDMLAAGREELRKAIAEIVRTARGKGWVNTNTAERRLEKLEEGRVLKEGWPKYHVGLTHSGALEVKFGSPNPDSIAREAQRLENMGLEERRHFTVKMPEGGEAGYVYIRREGLAYAAWLSVHGSGEQQKLAAEFVEHILQRAKEACGGTEQCAVYEKAKEIVEEGKAWGSVKLERFEKKVEVNGKTYVVKVIGGEAVEEEQNGKTQLRIRITAEVGRVEGERTIVDRVVREYIITYSRRGADNAAKGRTYASAEAPGGREADAERLSALIKALTDEEPKVYRMNNGRIFIECYEGHLNGFMRYAELADTIAKWLEKTSR